MNTAILPCIVEESIELYAGFALTRFYGEDGQERMTRTAFHFPADPAPALAIVDEPLSPVREAAGEALAAINNRRAPKRSAPVAKQSWWAFIAG